MNSLYGILTLFPEGMVYSTYELFEAWRTFT